MHEKDQIISIGREKVNLRDISKKLEQDIHFLQERIHLMKSFRKPNEIMIKTYNEMLQSRESVRTWLREQSVDNQASHST